MNKLNQVQSIMNQANGKFMTVVFEKADGTLRTMNGRTGVKKHLQGGIKTFDAKDTDNSELTVGIYETNVGYRCFKASRVKSITTGGITTTFNR